MISKEQFIQSIQEELHIIRHLAEKLTPEMLPYRPTDTQRSIQELLQYMGTAFSASVTANIEGGSMEKYQELFNNAPEITLENFSQHIIRQEHEITEKISALSEQDLQKEYTVFGVQSPLALHLLSVFKWITAYKMQLFLYMKANGMNHIGTMNLWRGMDALNKE